MAGGDSRQIGEASTAGGIIMINVNLAFVAVASMVSCDVSVYLVGCASKAAAPRKRAQLLTCTCELQGCWGKLGIALSDVIVAFTYSR